MPVALLGMMSIDIYRGRASLSDLVCKLQRARLRHSFVTTHTLVAHFTLYTTSLDRNRRRPRGGDRCQRVLALEAEGACRPPCTAS